MVGKCILRLPFCTGEHKQVILSAQGSFCYIMKKKKPKNMEALFSGHTASHHHKHSFYLCLDETCYSCISNKVWKFTYTKDQDCLLTFQKF